MIDMAGQNDVGRAVVRAQFCDPIAAAGLKRPKGVSQAAFEAGLDRLIGQLDHMSGENLAALADAVIDAAAKAVGQARGCWPAFVLVQSWGHGLQARPFRLSRIVTSWLASIEGPRAVAGGYEVQLLRFLKQYQRPPTPVDMDRIRQQAARDARQLELVVDRAYRGAARDDDGGWHMAYLGDQAQARAYVDQGIAGRKTGEAA